MMYPVVPPEWGWPIVMYFFLGGLAGGAFFTAVLLELVGGDADRQAARWGYLVAFPLAVGCGVLLMIDLGRPERFWHMLLQSQTGAPMLKWWSPISIGSWGLLIFSAFSFVAFVDSVLALLRRPGRRGLLPPGPLRTGFLLVGALFAFFLAGYTGVLLNATNQPVWTDSPVLGALFLVSGASTAMALLALLVQLSRGAHSTVRKLEDADNWTILFELILLVVLVLSVAAVTVGGTNAAAVLLRGGYGLTLLLGVVVVGLLVPLGLHLRPRLLGAASPVVAAVLVLVGGLLLRYVVVMSAQAL